MQPKLMGAASGLNLEKWISVVFSLKEFKASYQVEKKSLQGPICNIMLNRMEAHLAPSGHNHVPEKHLGSY